MSFVITGEKIQQLCDIYIGHTEDFNYNPVIKRDSHKHMDIKSIPISYDNPYYVFCYSHRIQELSNIIHCFNNSFILVSHNSDGCIDNVDYVNRILDCNKLVKWYGQNVSFQHPKLQMVPIGIANSQWPHGDLSAFYNVSSAYKMHTTYFNFNIQTNIQKRLTCYEALRKKLDWLPNVDPKMNMIRLSTFKFCICPEGNGYDTHRLWECLYFKVIPIVIRSPFTDVLVQNKIPVIVLNNWNEYDERKLVYDEKVFDDVLYNKISVFNNNYWI